jgi:hypothetical protein
MALYWSIVIGRGGGLPVMADGGDRAEGWNGKWEGGVADGLLVFIDKFFFIQIHYRR